MEWVVIAGDGYPYKEPSPTFLSSFLFFLSLFLSSRNNLLTISVFPLSC